MTWPTWAVSLWGAAWVLLGLMLERRRSRRELQRALARACDRLDHQGMPCEAEHCFLKYKFVRDAMDSCLEGIEPWQPIDYAKIKKAPGGTPFVYPVVTGAPGTVYECPDHGRFIPEVPPLHDPDRPEAKCRAWLPDGRTYCGKFCPPVPR
jgi:hypothetical protein